MPIVHRASFGIHCELFGCGELIEVTEREFRRGYVDACPHCGGAIWPCALGFTGNIPSVTNEFARTHNYDGSKKAR